MLHISILKATMNRMIDNVSAIFLKKT